jgi:hypothetical protein
MPLSLRNKGCRRYPNKELTRRNPHSSANSKLIERKKLVAFMAAEILLLGACSIIQGNSKIITLSIQKNMMQAYSLQKVCTGLQNVTGCLMIIE